MKVSRVLIADDDFELANALASRCRTLGIAAEIATTASDALSGLGKQPPDLAILDVDMPEGNGLAVCEMIMHNAALKNLPVVILTGKEDPNTIQRCHELRAFYVTKCVDVWPRIHPLLEELLELPAASSREASTDESQAPQVKPISPASQLMDAVFEVLEDDQTLFDRADSDVADQPSRPWVLCIDDDASFSFGLQLRLQEQGVDVLRAFAGREGYRSAFHSRAQAIVLDYELPEGNGDYVLRRLKENPVTRDIPVVVLTGRRDRHIERQMYNMGAACFMNKPYDWAELWRELSRHITLPPVERPGAPIALAK